MSATNKPVFSSGPAAEPVNLERRQWLLGSAGVVAGAGLMGWSPLALAQDGALPDYVGWKDPEALIVHSANTLETRRDAIGRGVLTPSDQLFVRNNLPAPGNDIVADPDGWTLDILGAGQSGSVSLKQLKTMGVETVVSVLQCSGNGRKFFPHGASGTQWEVGAAGCVAWTGVPLREVVRELGGVMEGMNYITATGGEILPEGLDPKSVMVERSVPLAALEQALLAWEMNDDPLSLAHGGPLRLVVPGYFGVNNVKYVRQIAFTAEQSDAKIQSSGYRVREVGVEGAPDQPSMWEMPVKSWITSPLTTAAAGRTLIYGVAFGGNQALGKVEVSLDDGGSWAEARLLGPDLGRFAWRPFVLAAELAPGEYRVVSRATDAQGQAQPPERTDNERGYGHNGWKDHGVSLTVA
ncbi:sulfite oxidase [Zobellella endophytica]|uniref:SorT family sulfite dehydrogenase catalytic subunit n=1 Tax=Zobellella endophytica TaxID=2116700 RepID=UPI001B303332|nr:sulfite oxidase [Zobellella endophytica]